ncbi:hypothetical protein BRARA_B03441 [Brassica rapa]|uniref:RIN4 pathogenic type III effector avirulence factor Avr cleavage site domain-containing protein n=1 Tax=Brassica campestris TaxID=3711 RepID=A0A398AFA6_BRACM|nr:hypothetical protein BRARA_B03441 [Brassica rapa]
MDYEYGGGEYCRRGHVPAFGGWNWNDAVPFTQCFETATTQQPSYLHHHYPPYPQDRDLYLAGDLYDNHHLVAPAVILLPRRRAKVGQEPKRTSSKEQHKFKKDARESNAPRSCPTPVVKPRTARPKPVDEDLYKVSPRLLSLKSTKKRGGGFGCISRCFLPTRVL